MKAITVEPKKPGSARLEEIPEPDLREGSVLVEAVAVGVCGTDVEIVEGKYGWAPSGQTRLVLGHESLGRVVDPGPTGGLKKGDLVAGIVRRPDPVPCPNCAVGEWDMCRNGQYTERGIKQIHGFMSERWRIEPEYVVKVDRSLGLLGVLLEPATVVAKAWEQVVAVGQRAFWEPRTVLVTGAGPIGLLAALLGKQRGLEIHVLDRAESGPKPKLVRDLGATYHSGSVKDIGFEPDVIVECTGVGQVIARVASGDRRGRHRLSHRRRHRRDRGRGDRGRRGGQDGAGQQRDRRQRQRQQAALVQGRGSAGPRGSILARSAGHATRAAGGLHARTGAGARRHQGRHPVRRGLVADQPWTRTMNDRKDQRVPWQPIVAEFVGTALLVLVGLSVVIS